MLNRRTAIGMLAAPWVSGATQMYLIAHRGGVVGYEFAENSPGSVEAAIARGYWMIEVDIRRSKDGHAVVQHDPTFARYFNVNRAVADMTWAEIQALRATPGGTRPMGFEELCKRCEGRIRLMLDIKADDYPDDFLRGLERAMSRYDLLHSAYTLGGQRVKRFFRGKLKLSANRKELQAAVSRGEKVAETYFLFELGSVMDHEAVARCRQHGVEPVAALNTFRYEMEKIGHWKGAERDVRKLLPLGVTHFQIDSIYDRLFAPE